MTKSTAIDSTYLKAQRAALGGKEGARSRRSAARAVGGRPNVHALTLPERAGPITYLLGDKGYGADRLRRSLREAGAVPVIPGRGGIASAPFATSSSATGRHLIENAFCRLKDFRRIATRYDKFAANFLSGVALANALAFWL